MTEKINTDQIVEQVVKVVKEMKINLQGSKSKRADAEISLEAKKNQRDLQTAIMKGEQSRLHFSYMYKQEE